MVITSCDIHNSKETFNTKIGCAENSKQPFKYTVRCIFSETHTGTYPPFYLRIENGYQDQPYGWSKTLKARL